MGMLLEMVEIISNLNKTLSNKDLANLKRKIIENSIFGIDIETSAVDIAKLRFWLSLVVDEDKPTPLPNLYYKIMAGNSLFESIYGYDILQKDFRGKKIRQITTTALGGRAVLVLEFIEFKQETIKDEESFFIKIRQEDGSEFWSQKSFLFEEIKAMEFL